MATKTAPVPGLTVDRKKLPKLPVKVGSLLDLRWQLKLQKDAVQAVLNSINDDIKLVEEAIFLRFGKEGDLEGARGKFCQASISKLLVPTAENWPDIFDYIKKGKGVDRFSLVQKRLSVTTVREYQDGGETIPGVGSFEQRKLSLTKVK